MIDISGSDRDTLILSASCSARQLLRVLLQRGVAISACRAHLRLDSRYRRLVRDFEHYAGTVATFFRLATIRLMLRRLISPTSWS